LQENNPGQIWEQLCSVAIWTCVSTLSRNHLKICLNHHQSIPKPSHIHGEKHRTIISNTKTKTKTTQNHVYIIKNKSNSMWAFLQKPIYLMIFNIKQFCFTQFDIYPFLRNFNTKPIIARILRKCICWSWTWNQFIFWILT